MAHQPHRAIFFHRQLVVLFAVAAFVATATAETAAAASAPSPDETQSAASASFLRARCATTLYPALCHDSLLPYAGEFQTSHSRLARVAADVAAARLRALLARVQDMLHHAPRTGTSAAGGGGGGPSEADALHDCASTISSAANLARQSSTELAGLDADDAGSSSSSTSAAGGSSSSSRRARWSVSNAKTWLSAAITNEGTCADGIEEAGIRESPSGKEVDAGVASVKQHTSIALALVNGIPM
ncbi:hypothetical protein EJB05_22958, partial [Eragrostis curvula]